MKQYLLYTGRNAETGRDFGKFFHQLHENYIETQTIWILPRMFLLLLSPCTFSQVITSFGVLVLLLVKLRFWSWKPLYLLTVIVLRTISVFISNLRLIFCCLFLPASPWAYLFKQLVRYEVFDNHHWNPISHTRKAKPKTMQQSWGCGSIVECLMICLLFGMSITVIKHHD